MSYAVEHASAYADILAAGSAVTFSTPFAGGYDAATDTTAVSGTATVPGVAIRVKGDPRHYVALGLTETDAPTLLFCPAAYGELPSLGASVDFGGASFVVKSVSPVAPNGDAIIARIIVAGSGAGSGARVVVGSLSWARPDITFAMASPTLATA